MRRHLNSALATTAVRSHGTATPYHQHLIPQNCTDSDPDSSSRSGLEDLVIVRGLMVAKSAVKGGTWKSFRQNVLVSQDSGDRAVIVQRTQTDVGDTKKASASTLPLFFRWLNRHDGSSDSSPGIMSVQEYQADSTMMDLLEGAGCGSARWMPYGFPLKEELRPRLNRQPIGDPTCKLRMRDVAELTPALLDKYLTDYREEIQRMCNRGLTVSSTGPATSTVVGWRN